MADRLGIKPAWWLRNCHVQSCIGTAFSHKLQAQLDWEQLELADGDFIDLCWAGQSGRPIVVLLHGMEGSIESPYIQLMMDVLIREGYHVVVMHFRSCSGRLNRLASSYHSSETKDFEYFLGILRQRYPGQFVSVIGFSLGGNVLLHHLANSPDSLIKSAVTVSVPFEINKTVDSIPRFYQWALLRTIKPKLIQKIKLGLSIPLTVKQVKDISTFRQFDNLVTAPSYGFKDADDYYAKSSVRSLLRQIEHSVLVIHAKDDPLVPANSIPQQHELSKSITFDLYERGGHVGFLQGRAPWRLNQWFQVRLLAFLKQGLLLS